MYDVGIRYHIHKKGVCYTLTALRVTLSAMVFKIEYVFLIVAELYLIGI
jgi:hypothetical protein